MSETPAKSAENQSPAPAPETLEDKVIARLRSVFDPEIPVNIYDLGLIYKIESKATTGAAQAGGKFDLAIDMTLTAPACPVAGQMPGMVERALDGLEEIREVTVTLVWDPPWDKSRMSDAARMQLGFF